MGIMKEFFNQLKINFSGSDKPVTTPTEDYVVGLVHTILGDGNKWHSKFSEYNISTLLGGKPVDGHMCFPDGAYFLVSSSNEEFMSEFVGNLYKLHDKLQLRDMKMTGFSFSANDICSGYDIVRTISPLLLKVKGKRIVTYKDDDFIELLTKQCKAKLLHKGFTENDLKSFSIEPFKWEGASVKITKRKNYKLPASMVMMVVKGKPKCRKALYEMGLGSSTGYCYGTVHIERIHQD